MRFWARSLLMLLAGDPASLPKNHSGKIMRRLIKAQDLGLDPGDIMTLEE